MYEAFAALVLHDIFKFHLNIITIKRDHKAREKMSHLMKISLFLLKKKKT